MSRSTPLPCLTSIPGFTGLSRITWLSDPCCDPNTTLRENQPYRGALCTKMKPNALSDPQKNYGLEASSRRDLSARKISAPSCS
jgi:hypothetical protein